MLLPRSLSHHTPHGTPQHPPVDLRLSLFSPFPPSLSHLLYHQADNAAGLSAWHSTSLPMSRFPHSLSLSVSLQSFFLSLSLPLSRHLFYPGVTDYYSADGCGGECREMTHNTSKLEQAGKHHLYIPPPSPNPNLTSLSQLKALLYGYAALQKQPTHITSI